MRKLIANSSYTKTIQIIVGVSVQAVVSEVGTPSQKIKALPGNGLLKSGYQITVSNITDPGAGATIPDPGPYTVSFTAQATKVREGNFFLRIDDETGIINATPQIPGSPPVNFPVQFKYKITNAGQTKVLGE